MKLEKEESKIEVSGDIDTLNFGIDQENLGIVFDTLRSKIYENPIGSICREISSNSRDANREVGKQNVPIKITMESGQSSIFFKSDYLLKFQDQGPGLSPERMKEVFVNYGSSTKRSTNKFTGGFGLGSKTPFSYTDNFVIETVFNKEKFTYSAVVEKNQPGNIFLIDRQPTEEENGTSIIIPINRGDKDRFETECRFYTEFWPVKPEFVGFCSAREPKVRFENDLFIIAEDFRFNDIGAIIDGIPYHISNEELKIKNNYSNFVLLLKLKTGDVSITANREKLHCDEHTVKFLKNKFHKVKEMMISTINDELVTKKNLFEARCYFGSLHLNEIHPHFLAFIKQLDGDYSNTDFCYGGKKITYAVNSEGLDFSIQHPKNGQLNCSSYSNKFLTMPVLLIDQTRFSKARDGAINDGNGFVAIEVDGIVLFKKILNAETLKEKKGILRENRGLIKIHRAWKKMKASGLVWTLYSESEKLKIVREKNTAPGEITGIVIPGGHRHNTTRIASANTDKYICVCVEDVRDCAKTINICNAIYALIKKDIFVTNKRNEKYFTQVETTESLIAKHVSKENIQLAKDQCIYEEIKCNYLYRNILNNGIFEHPFLTSKITAKNYSNYLEFLTNDIDFSPEALQFKLDFEAFVEKYPLLKYMDSYRVGNPEFQLAFKDYIEAIQAKNQK